MNPKNAVVVADPQVLIAVLEQRAWADLTPSKFPARNGSKRSPVNFSNPRPWPTPTIPTQSEPSGFSARFGMPACPTFALNALDSYVVACPAFQCTRDVEVPIHNPPWPSARIESARGKLIPSASPKQRAAVSVT